MYRKKLARSLRPPPFASTFVDRSPCVRFDSGLLRPIRRELGAQLAPRLSRRLLAGWSALGLALALAGCGDLYSAQSLPLREYAAITLAPGCVPADGLPWVVDAEVQTAAAAYVLDASWVGEGEDLSLDVHHVPCAALLAGASDPSTEPVTGEGLKLCLVATAEPGAAKGERSFTLYVEDGDGTIVVNGELDIQPSCEEP